MYKLYQRGGGGIEGWERPTDRSIAHCKAISSPAEGYGWVDISEKVKKKTFSQNTFLKISNPIPALEWKLALLLVFNQGFLLLLLPPLLVVVVVDEDVVQLEK